MEIKATLSTRQEITSVREDVKIKESSQTAAENINWCSYYEKQ